MIFNILRRFGLESEIRESCKTIVTVGSRTEVRQISVELQSEHRAIREIFRLVELLTYLQFIHFLSKILLIFSFNNGSCAVLICIPQNVIIQIFYIL